MNRSWPGLALLLWVSFASARELPCACLEDIATQVDPKPRKMRLRLVVDLSTSVLSWRANDRQGAVDQVEAALRDIEAARCAEVHDIRVVPVVSDWPPDLKRQRARLKTLLCDLRDGKALKNRYSPLVSFAKALAALSVVDETVWISDLRDCADRRKSLDGQCNASQADEIADQFGGRRGKLGWYKVGPVGPEVVAERFVDRTDLGAQPFECGVGAGICGAAVAALQGTTGVPAGSASDDARRLPKDAVVAVLRTDGGLCTGVRVSPEHILTARHCLPAKATLAGLDLVTERESPVKTVIEHDDPRVDAALLVLERRQPGPIMRMRSAEDDSGPHSEVIALGYGARDPRGQRGGGRLRDIALNAAGWACSARDSGRFGCQPNLEMVVRRSAGADTCDGDSGGPLLEPTPVGFIQAERTPGGTCSITLSASESLAHIGDAVRPIMCDALARSDKTQVRIETCAWRQVALTSRPIREARRRCGDGGVYVRIDRIYDWLKRHVPGLTN